MDNFDKFWTKGSVGINPEVLTKKSWNKITISDEGLRDLGNVIKKSEKISEFINYLDGGKSIYNFPPGTFCK